MTRTGKYLTEDFQTYVSGVLPDGLPEELIEEFRLAFYAGGISACLAMQANDTPINELIPQLEKLARDAARRVDAALAAFRTGRSVQ
jgi:hypothetical protein